MSSSAKPKTSEPKQVDQVHLRGNDFDTIALNTAQFIRDEMRRLAVARGELTEEQANSLPLCPGCLASTILNLSVAFGKAGDITPSMFLSMTNDFAEQALRIVLAGRAFTAATTKGDH